MNDKRRITTGSHYDPTITQRVRTILMEGGHYDVVAEQFVEALRDIETMARKGLKDHDARIKVLEDAERDRLTKTGAWTFVKSKLDEQAVSWMTWAIRGTIGAVGGALIWLILRLAWKGAHAQ